MRTEEHKARLTEAMQAIVDDILPMMPDGMREDMAERFASATYHTVVGAITTGMMAVIQKQKSKQN